MNLDLNLLLISAHKNPILELLVKGEFPTLIYLHFISLSALLLTEQNSGSRWLQFPENPERQQYRVVYSGEFHKRCRAGPLEKTACPECNHGQLEPDTTQASLGSAQNSPLERYPWLPIPTPAGYPGDLLRCLNSRAHTSDHPKGCVLTFTIQADMWRVKIMSASIVCYALSPKMPILALHKF